MDRYDADGNLVLEIQRMAIAPEVMLAAAVAMAGPHRYGAAPARKRKPKDRSKNKIAAASRRRNRQ